MCCVASTYRTSWNVLFLPCRYAPEHLRLGIHTRWYIWTRQLQVDYKASTCACGWSRRHCMSSSKSAVYSWNGIGPRTKSFGTPYSTTDSVNVVRCKPGDDRSSKTVRCLQPLEQGCNRWNRVAWLTCQRQLTGQNKVTTAMLPGASANRTLTNF